ncbi:MAG: RNA polymerase sigma factor [Candidatus Pristimantibacillus lignocellulolyticus]|uniref:RNA polymerase sigma factor n=1 Tax=Candidatus Pristimantibacillus lignocellulolyticus TaxID=2994561 RepID=A0A9J6ZHM5_9BACL|nr:MAG: RNA polymerase sigma factor [Candidatus Pristimantibacillus lignocellulolyticus]
MKPNLERRLIDYIMNNKNRFYLLAYSYTHNEQDALDIVQDSIRKALEHLDSLHGEPQMKSWFYQIVVRTSIDFLRKHKRTSVVEDQVLETMMTAQMDTYTDLDLQVALHQLPTIYREVIILRFFEDMKIEDIAHVLNNNINTVKARLYKALKILKIEMQDEEGASCNG